MLSFSTPPPCVCAWTIWYGHSPGGSVGATGRTPMTHAYDESEALSVGADANYFWALAVYDKKKKLYDIRTVPVLWKRDSFFFSILL